MASTSHTFHTNKVEEKTEKTVINSMGSTATSNIF